MSPRQVGNALEDLWPERGSSDQSATYLRAAQELLGGSLRSPLYRTKVLGRLAPAGLPPFAATAMERG